MTGHVLTYWRLNATDVSDIHTEIILLVLVIWMSSKVSHWSKVEVFLWRSDQKYLSCGLGECLEVSPSSLKSPTWKNPCCWLFEGEFNKTVKPGRKEACLSLSIPFSIQNSPGSRTLPAKDLWVNYAKSEDIFLPNLELTLWNFHVISTWPQEKHFC